jgi:lipoprotein-anchoring transpeptidase ErfK/SrfK
MPCQPVQNRIPSRRWERTARLVRLHATAVPGMRGALGQWPSLSTRSIALGVCCVAVLVVAAPAHAAPKCATRTWASAAAVGRPTDHLAWRAELLGRTQLWSRPARRRHRVSAVTPAQAPWLLVLRSARDRRGRCWVQVRLPTRPNTATAWIEANRTRLRATPWRIVVTRAARALDVYRAGRRLRRLEVVVGKPSTPSPHGLFSIVGVWRWNPADFLGSYILPLTAHSNVLQDFGGGDGRVGIHGRGGASLLDPLGSARSHGCIRLANPSIDWIVRRIAAGALPGIPVRVR